MLTPGTLLGERYEIIEKIGVGGMSIVYKAKDERLQRYVAIKELREEFVEDEEFVNKFRREALAAASLSHPNIVGIYDVGSDHDIHYIVMEYVEGKTLKQLIEEEGPFDYKKVLELGIQIVSALKHAHSKKIIHRDIKPQNILMTHDGTLKVTDFGIAKAVDSSTIVASGSAIGSVHYFSPEQAKGRYVNQSSDLYSCGIVLFELATKRLPFDADSHISIALKHINEELPKPSFINPDIPQSLEQIILKATSKNQVDRYQHADEMLEDMKGVLADPHYIISKNPVSEHTILLSPKETEILRQGQEPIVEEPGEEKTEVVEEKTGAVSESIYEESVKFEEPEEDEEAIPTFYKVMISVAGVLATLVVAIIISLVVFFMWPSKVYSVPNVMNHTLKEATRIIKNSNLKYKVISEEVGEDGSQIVIDQNPKSGAKLKKNGVIELTLAPIEIDSEEESQERPQISAPVPEQVEVPNLIKLETKQAQEELTTLQLVLNDVSFEYSDDIEAGLVISQTPEAGTEVTAGSQVDIVVSKGPEKEEGVTVPTVVGKRLEEAVELLNANGLRVKIEQVYNEQYEAGIVVEQTDNAAFVKPNTQIKLKVSKGPEVIETPEVPEVPEETEKPTESPLPEESTSPEEGTTDDNASSDSSAEQSPSTEEEQAAETTITRSISLPVGTEVKDSYVLLVKFTSSSGESKILFNGPVAYGEPLKTVSITGKGTGVLFVSIDGASYKEDIIF